MRVAAVRKALSMRVVPIEDINFGLTPESLLLKMQQVSKFVLMKKIIELSCFF